jgi:fumarate reductase subunit D
MPESFFDHDQTKDETSGKGGIPDLDGGHDQEGRPAEDRRMAAVMAYIPFLCFVPLIKMRDDPYAYFHARQGIVLFFLEVIAFIFSFPHLSQLFWTVIIIACIGAAVAGIIFSLQGKMYKLPIIGELADRLRM